MPVPHGREPRRRYEQSSGRDSDTSDNQRILFRLLKTVLHTTWSTRVPLRTARYTSSGSAAHLPFGLRQSRWGPVIGAQALGPSVPHHEIRWRALHGGSTSISNVYSTGRNSRADDNLRSRELHAALCGELRLACPLGGRRWITSDPLFEQASHTTAEHRSFRRAFLSVVLLTAER
jgi:hypothetical protein